MITSLLLPHIAGEKRANQDEKRSFFKYASGRSICAMKFGSLEWEQAIAEYVGIRVFCWVALKRRDEVGQLLYVQRISLNSHSDKCVNDLHEAVSQEILRIGKVFV